MFNADPDVPAIGFIDVGENSANVSWYPAQQEPPVNPGGRFYVEYVKVSDAGLCRVRKALHNSKPSESPKYLSNIFAYNKWMNLQNFMIFGTYKLRSAGCSKWDGLFNVITLY